MSLLSNYQSRYSTQIRTNASNPQAPDETSVDTARETAAATDAEAIWESVTGIAYDDDEAIHVASAVPLVYETLLLYTGQISQDAYDKILGRLEDRMKLVLGRNRITPTTNSTLSPTIPLAGQKPFSDETRFDRYIGRAPAGDEHDQGRD